MDAVMKGLVIAIGIYDTMLWRSLIAVGFSALLWVGLHRRRPTRAALRLHLVRGAVSTAIALLFFWGLGRSAASSGGEECCRQLRSWCGAFLLNKTNRHQK